MKALRYWKMTALVAATLMVASCSTVQNLLGRKSKKSQAVESEYVVPDTLQKDVFLQRVTNNAQSTRFITSKLKFSVEVGNRQMTLTGNLKMKRDLKVPYAQLDFFRHSGVDFNLLQSLFWNELFQPGKARLTEKNLKKFTTDTGVDNDVVISFENDVLSYRWLTEQETARIKMANVLYNNHLRGNYQLNWDYDDFKVSNRKMFPMKHKVTFSTPDNEIKLEMMLNYLGNDEDWEPRTVLSGKYRQMPVDEILRRFMSL